MLWLENLFAHPNGLGYRELNIGVRIPLAGGRSHIAEIMITLREVPTLLKMYF